MRSALQGGVSLLSAGALIAGITMAGQGGAAEPTPVSQSGGTFLSGSLLGTDLDALAKLEHATAVNNGGATVLDNHPLDATVLSALNVPLGSGIDLLGPNGLLSLGAVAQYASASPDGSSKAASGAVTDSGAIAVGGSQQFPADATLNLSGLIGSDLATQLANVTAKIGAVSGTASQTAAGAQSGGYQIAGLQLNLTSPLVSGIVAQARTLLASLQPTVDGIATVVNGLNLGQVVTVGTPPTLTDLLTSLGDVTSADGAIKASLTTGVVTIDVAKVLTSAGLDLNNLPPGTELLPYVTKALTTELLPALTKDLTGTGGLVDKIAAAVRAIDITVLGTPVTSPALDAALTNVITSLTTPLTNLADSLGTQVVTPLAIALTQVLSLTANVQQTTAGTFTETALRVGLLPGSSTFTPATVHSAAQTGTGAAVVNLAAATVGPNAGPGGGTSGAPTTTGINPDRGPTSGGTPVTVTGTGFVPGSTSVTIGGTTVPASQVTVGSSTSLTFVTPPHAAGGVDVTVTTPGGTSGPQTYTYVPGSGNVPTVTGLNPDRGPTSGGTPVTVTGTGFVPGSTSVTIGGTTVPASQVTVGSSTSLTFVTPPHAAGGVDVTVTTPGGTSGPQTYTYVPGTVRPVITDPKNGDTVTDPTPPITGTGEPGSTIVVSSDGDPICTAKVSTGGTWTCTPVVPLSDGDHTLEASSGGQVSVPVTITVVSGGGNGTTGPPVITDPGNGDTVTDPTPPITGTGNPGSTVTVTDGGTPVCTAKVKVNGTWTCTPTTPLSDGTHTIVATSGGKPSAPVTFTVDTGNGAGGNGNGTGTGNGNGGGTADTGVDALALLAIGFLLAVAGAALTMRGRRNPILG